MRSKVTASASVVTCIVELSNAVRMTSRIVGGSL
jgi:hypothetical protein